MPISNDRVSLFGRSHQGIKRWLLRAGPTAFIVAALLATAYWGHASGWNFWNGQVADPPATPPTELPRPAVRFQPTGAEVARIEFGTASEVTAAGIDIAVVWPTSLTEQVAGAGEVTFDPARLARIPARAGGVTRRVYKAAGDSVQAGEVLALIDSIEVGKAKAEFQHALVQARLRERRRDDLVGSKSASSPAAIREAEAALKEADVQVLAASQTLTNLGLPLKSAEYRALTPKDVAPRIRLLGVEDAAKDLDVVTANLLPVRASFKGVVLSADAVAGEVVEAGKALFAIVDPSRVWVTVNVGPEESRRVAVSQQVYFRPDGSSREHSAKVISIGAAADETTRTVPVRAEAENAAGELRASTLGRGRIILREVPKALVVPHEAVHRFRDQTVVFVRDPDFLKADGAKAFHARVVTTGGQDERNTEILAGVSPGEIVATAGSEKLLSELMRAAASR